MAKSQRLCESDIRAAFRLLDECGEMWADPVGWQTHLLQGLQAMIGAKSCTYFESDNPPRWPRDMHDVGWDADERERFEAAREKLMFSGPGFYHNPMHASLMSQYDGRSPITRSRPQLIDDDAWYGSLAFNEYHRPADNDDAVVFGAPRQDRAEGVLINLNRSVRDRPFSEWDRKLLGLIARELSPQIGTRLCTYRHRSMHGLSPRQRQTLELLLEGEGEKQIAYRLGLSRATVHEYVGAVYRHFGVQSRGKLLAYFIQRRPALMEEDAS